MDPECEKYWKEVRPRQMEAHEAQAKLRWQEAFKPDYDYEFFLMAMKAKLENMADYFYTLAPIGNGTYYAGQMALAVRLLDIILDEGGRDQYSDTDSDDPADWFKPECFIPKVNMKNAQRFLTQRNKAHFFCDAQEVRFNKAWHLFLRILDEKLYNWSD